MQTTPVAHEQRIKRFQYLWTWELIDSFLLPAMGAFAAYSNDSRLGVMFLYGSLVLALLLWQATAYWRMKLAAERVHKAIDPQSVEPFRRWKKLNWIALAALPAAIFVEIRLGKGQFWDVDFFWGLLLYILAILEQINYYYFQLMYDYPDDWAMLLRTKKLKKSSLRRVMEKLD